MPKFQRRHYTAIAEVITAATEDQGSLLGADRVRIVRAFSAVFARDNPAFDRVRFLFACGIAEDESSPVRGADPRD